ncbi:MAG: SurA N-terminal domain-containing protein [Chloroflexota bacterium]|nr:SurA N-terminal domain-containing protein [Chloroflexota bacterium]
MDGMSIQPTKNLKLLFVLIIFLLLITACSGKMTSVAEEDSTKEAIPSTLTPTRFITSTPTQEPAAAVVNGEVIAKAWFESEFARYLLAQEAAETPVKDEAAAREIVLEDLIDQVLLAQGARDDGFTVTDEKVQERIDDLSEDVDLPAWMAKWGYTETDLFHSLKLQMQAVDQRDRILNTIPEIVEQVELRQVFAYTEDGADRALVSLNSGTPFEDVAFLYDPTTGGYLGWVPRGYLLNLKIEEAAFSLPVGTYSEIIESDIGYHIVLVIDREERPLTNDAKLTLQRKALQEWIVNQREISTIEKLID